MNFFNYRGFFVCHNVHYHCPCRQAKAVLEHLCCAECPSAITVAQVTKCSTSHAGLANLRVKSDQQEILLTTSSKLRIHKLLLIEEHPQEAVILTRWICWQAYTIQRDANCPLRDAYWESRRVLRQAHEDVTRRAAVDGPTVRSSSRSVSLMTVHSWGNKERPGASEWLGVCILLLQWYYALHPGSIVTSIHTATRAPDNRHPQIARWTPINDRMAH